MRLTRKQKVYISAEIRRLERIIRCPGCGIEFPRGTHGKRYYCTPACGKRHHWVKVRNSR